MAVKGEKPSVTIRLLRRQLSIAQATVKALQLDRTDKETVIAGYHAEVTERDEVVLDLQARCADQAEFIGRLQEENRCCQTRLAYLEGYYARSQETTPQAVSAARALVSGDPPQTHPGRREGDSEDIPDGRRRETPPRQSYSPSRLMEGLGSQVRGQRPHDSDYPRRNQVEHVEIKEPPL